MKQLTKNNYFWFFTLITLIVSVIVILIITAEPTMARPGGGHSYSGGSRSSHGGGGGGGGGDALGDLIILIFTMLPTEVQIPLIILIVVVAIIRQMRKKNTTVHSAPTYETKNMSTAEIDRKIELFKQEDPSFSKILFLDFVSLLYHKYYAHFGKKQFSNILPFISDAEVSKTPANTSNKRDISEIVIGNLRIADIRLQQDYTAIAVEIDANYTVTMNGKSTRFIVTEKWLFNRKRGVQSHEPKKMQEISCPNCGAPADFTDAGQCNHCSTFINKGETQWVLQSKNILSQETFQPSTLATYSAEVGTDYPTIYQNSLRQNMEQFQAKHGINFQNYWNDLRKNVVSAYFIEIYSAWSAQRWSNIRHLVSDRLFEQNSFWQKAFKEQQLQNKLENIQVKQIELVRLDMDQYYEAFHVRIFASCLDYVSDRAGNVIGGSNRKPREYSEYWTFVRRSGVTKDNFDLKSCPNCGAPADKMGQAAVCEYCGSKISTGEFSWVLSLITQDEVYQG